MTFSKFIVEKEKRQITIERIFDAPRDLVFETMTDPKLISQWWGPREYATTVDRMDFRPGGVWRFVQRSKEGKEFAFNGIYKEVVIPEKFAYTFEFEGMPGHTSFETLIFKEKGKNNTKVIDTVVFKTLEDLEGMVNSGMETGVNDSTARFAELLEIIQT